MNWKCFFLGHKWKILAITRGSFIGGVRCCERCSKKQEVYECKEDNIWRWRDVK